jgi:hypothetical protein
VLLVFAGTEDPAELTALLARRKQALLAKAEELALARTQGEEKGYLLPSVSPLQAASFRRTEIRIAAELAWHEECGELLGSPSDQLPRPAGASRTRPSKTACLSPGNVSPRARRG